MTAYHRSRTVEWGHWGIAFFAPQPDETKNYGVLVGRLSFPVSTRGPMDGDKKKYRAACTGWVAQRIQPEGFVLHHSGDAS